MSRRLKKLIEEEEKTMARISELQDFLKEIREARKKEEDLEIVRSIRSMKLGARDLFDLLTAIQDGNLSGELREQLLTEAESDEAFSDSCGIMNPGMDGREADGTAGAEDEKDPEHEDGDTCASEREENDDDKQHD